MQLVWQPTFRLTIFSEVIGAVVKIIDNRVEEDRETTIEELLDIVKGPDFPTGADDSWYKGYRGSISYRTGQDPCPCGDQYRDHCQTVRIPYCCYRASVSMVNKARLIEKIAELVQETKRLTELPDLRMITPAVRECVSVLICAEMLNANVVLNQLYKHTQLQDTFGVIMLCLVSVNGSLQPKVLTLPEMLEALPCDIRKMS